MIAAKVCVIYSNYFDIVHIVSVTGYGGGSRISEVRDESDE